MARTAVLVKFPDDLLARVEGWANGEGMNRMEAIVSLLNRALDESGPSLAKVEIRPGRGGSAQAQHEVQLGPTRPAYGSRLKKR